MGYNIKDGAIGRSPEKLRPTISGKPCSDSPTINRYLQRANAPHLNLEIDLAEKGVLN